MVPWRRGLQLCLAFMWLLDAALQFQPFMFGSSFVTQVIEPTATGNPGAVAGPVTWASQLMLQHTAAFNAVFASIQLLIAIGIFFSRTVKPALAVSIAWALSVWWFGEGLGGILTGASPLTGVPGAVLLYALIATLLWPTARTPARRPTSPAAAGPLGAPAAKLVWLAVWGSLAWYLLLPANRAPDAISGIFAGSAGQPAWITAIMTGLSRATDHRGVAISILLAILCAVVGLAGLTCSLITPALGVAAILGLLFWIAEGFGGIFTGQGTDPNTGPLLLLLAACYLPYSAHPESGLG